MEGIPDQNEPTINLGTQEQQLALPPYDFDAAKKQIRESEERLKDLEGKKGKTNKEKKEEKNIRKALIGMNKLHEEKLKTAGKTSQLDQELGDEPDWTEPHPTWDENLPEDEREIKIISPAESQDKPDKIEVPKKLEKEKDKELEERRAAMEALHAPDVRKAEAETQAKINRVEVSQEHRTFIENFLSEDIKALQEEFAVKWFDDHKGELKEIQVEEAQREFKVKFVMKHWEDRKMESEMREVGDGKEQGYNEQFGDKIDNLLTLRHELTRESGVSAASPFLLLGYLMKRIDNGMPEIESENLYKAIKDLAGKTMAENIDKDAERKVDENISAKYINKEKYVEKELVGRKKEVEERENEKLIEEEWQKFQKLPNDEERNEFLIHLGAKPGQIDKQQFKERLYVSTNTAFGTNLEVKDFYALMKDGYKPYEAAITGYRSFWGIPEGVFERVKIKKGEEVEKMSARAFDELVEKLRKAREESFETQAKKELSEDWDKARNSAIRIRAKNRVRQIAELGPERVEKLTTELRDRIVQEYIEKHPKKEPESPAKEALPPPLDEKLVEPKKSVRVTKFEKVMAGKLIDDIYLARRGEGKGTGELAGLTGNIERDADILSNYFKKNFAVRSMTPKKILELVVGDSRRVYEEACRSNDNIDLISWFAKMNEKKPWKKNKI